ncbi:hypothetical protein D3C85_1804830 [compost metagenome]
MTKPIWNAVFNSEMTKAGIRTWVGMSSGRRGRSILAMDTNKARSFWRVCLNMNLRKGCCARSSATCWEMAPCA